MTEKQSIAAEESTETRLILPPIDYAAPGSRRLEKERRRLSGAWIEARDTYNETVDDLNEAREALLANPEHEGAKETFEREVARNRAALRALAEARDNYHEYLIGRMTTNDGTSVADALDAISQNDFDLLVTMDVESVVIPKVGAGISSGG
jgi:hypothetical protein